MHRGDCDCHVHESIMVATDMRLLLLSRCTSQIAHLVVIGAGLATSVYISFL